MMRRRFIFEVDDDNAEFSEAPADTSNEESDTPDTDNNTEDTGDQTEENTGEEETSPEESTEEEPGDDDFTIKDPEETSAEDDNNTDDSSVDTTTDDTASEDNQENSSDETDSPAKETERNLFDSLSPEEQEIKNKMLKKLFIDLYSNCDAIINKFNDIGSELEDVSTQIKKILSILFNLKQMIDDYLMNIYKTKSYIENDIVFNRYLSILNSVKNIIKEIDKYYDGTSK